MPDWNTTFIVGLPATAALAAVALIGYLFGRRTRRSDDQNARVQHLADLDRATRIACQLEAIAVALRQQLAAHHTQLSHFKKRLQKVQHHSTAASWNALCDEAEAILNPTLQLASQLSQAYDQLRKQSNALLTFTEGRVDPVTGVGNGRALEEQLDVLLASMQQGAANFSVALVGIDPVDRSKTDNEENTQQQFVQEVATTIQLTMRDNDFVARYGADEFVVVMPRTPLAGGSVFGDRLRKRIETDHQISVSCGIADAVEGDTIKVLLARADSALYSAKAAGANRQFLHTGTQIREHIGQRKEAASETCPDDAEAVCD